MSDLNFLHEKSIFLKNIIFEAKKKKRGHRNVFLSSQKKFRVNMTYILGRKIESAYGALYTAFGIPLFN